MTNLLPEPATETGPRPAHGLGSHAVRPDWAPLESAEADALLQRYPEYAPVTRVRWHSPRPFSSAAIVETAAGARFIKRHDRRVRTPAELNEEHDFARALAARRVPVSLAHRALDGRSALSDGRWTYEVHDVAPGVDLYRDAVSWSPFRSLAHARSAGRALATFQRAAAGYQAGRRAASVLVSRFEVIASAQPAATLQRLLTERPLLADYLRQRAWPADYARVLAPLHRELAPLLPRLVPSWTHNDWHASNLTWTTDDDQAEVATILDLGLADRTTAMYDLATAIERNAIPWLDVQDGRDSPADLAAAGALIDGYAGVRPLAALDIQVLLALLPIVHVDFALAEVEYYHGLVRNAAYADLAYDGFLLGHALWFQGRHGSELRRYLAERLADARPAGPRGFAVD